MVVNKEMLRNCRLRNLFISVVFLLPALFLGQASLASAATVYRTDSILRHNPGVTGAQLDDFIRHVHPDSRLIGLGQTWVNVGNRDNIDPVYLMAHAIVEAGWGGHSDIAVYKNNIYGWQAYDSDPYGSAKLFTSMEACIDYVSGQILANYLTSGGEYYTAYGPTLRGMNVNYATSQEWRNTICYIMNEFAGGYSYYDWPGIPYYRYPGYWSTPDWYWMFSNAGGFGNNVTNVSWTDSFYGDSPIVGAFEGAKPYGTHKQESIGVFRRGIYPNWRTVFYVSPAAPFAWFGDMGDQPLVGDFNSDGYDDIAIHRLGSFPNWFFKLSTGSGFAPEVYPLSWGNLSGDIPRVGDFNGDGKDDIAIYRYGSYPNWFIILNTTPVGSSPVTWGETWPISWGNPGGDTAIVGNFDGVGPDEFGIYRTGSYPNWFFLMSGAGNVKTGTTSPLSWGNSGGDYPIAGNFNGDARDDIGLFRISGYPNWFANFSQGASFDGATDSSLSFGNLSLLEHPFIGDFDGNGCDDVGIMRIPQP